MKENTYRYPPSYIVASTIVSIGPLLFIALIMLFFAKGDLISMLKMAINELKVPGILNKISGSIVLLVVIQPIILVPVLVYNTLMYKNFSIRLNETGICSEYKGMLKNKKKEVPLSHISNVNLNANIVYLLFGLREVKIDINSSETAMEDDYSIVLKKSQAEELKDKIREYSSENNGYTMNLQNESYIKTYDDKDVFEYKFNLNEVLRHILLSTGPFTAILFISGVISKLGDKNGSLLFISIFIIIKDILSGINDFYGLRLVADRESIHISHGITEIKTFDIPRKNIISISTSQSFLARIFGYKCISLDVIGMGNISGEGNLASLYMRTKKLEDYSKKSGLEIELEEKISTDGKYIYKPYNKLYKYYFMSSLWTLLLVLFAPYISQNRLIQILSLPISLLASVTIAYMRAHIKNINMSSKSFVIVSGIFSKTTEIVPYTKIDIVEKKQNFVQKYLGLASVNIYMRDHKAGKTVENTGLYLESTFDPLIDYYLNGEK